MKENFHYPKFIIFFDALTAAVCFFAVYFIRQASPLPEIQPLSFYYFFIGFSLTGLILIFYSYNLYNGRVLFSISYLTDLLKAVFLWGFLLVAFSFFSKTDYSRFVIVLFFGLTFLCLAAGRLIIFWLFPRRKEKNGDSEILESVKEIIWLCEISAQRHELIEALCGKFKPNFLYRFAKRLTDIFLAAFALVISLPLFIFIIFWIKKDSPGAAIIKQGRVGEKGKKFILYKFRTMYRDADLYAPAPRRDDDPRITQTGRILRRLSLDELPQLWNVLKGEMSIVGPRPEMPFIVRNYKPWQAMRLNVKPGITGPWQILGRKDIPLEENLDYDFYYITHQSFFLDLAIIIKTIPSLFLSRGAY